MTPRQRLHEAFLDVATEMPPHLIDKVAGIIESLLGHHRMAVAIHQTGRYMFTAGINH